MVLAICFNLTWLKRKFGLIVHITDKQFPTYVCILRHIYDSKASLWQLNITRVSPSVNIDV